MKSDAEIKDDVILELRWDRQISEPDAIGVAVKDAAFIDEHAGAPLTVTEVAAAAGVTARALQYALRRHYDTAPGAYVRRVRLERARRQLQAADPATGTTVAEIARSWGWANPANFATAYRKQFGVPPSHTLRS